MGASGAVRSGSTKAVQAPAFAAGARPCHPPDALARGEAARFAVMGSAEAIVALIMGITAQTLPGDLLVVQRQDVVVGAGGRWPSLTEKRNCGCHDLSNAFGPGPLAGCSGASDCIRCLHGGGTVLAGLNARLAGLPDVSMHRERHRQIEGVLIEASQRRRALASRQGELLEVLKSPDPFRRAKSLEIIVGAARFELATPVSQTCDWHFPGWPHPNLASHSSLARPHDGRPPRS